MVYYRRTRNTMAQLTQEPWKDEDLTMKKCKKRARLGFTITETLVVVAILAFVTAAGAVVTGTVIGTRNAMIEAGDCQSLVSTAILTIADEIRLGRKVEVREETDGTKAVYVDSATFGTDTHFSLADGRIKAENKDGGKYDLLTEKEYSQLQINDLKLEYDATAAPDSITISMEAVGMNGKIYATSLTVTPINGIK